MYRTTINYSFIVILIWIITGYNYSYSQILQNSTRKTIGNCQGVPSYPGIIKYEQSDGNILEIYQHGDAVIHWAESKDNYTLLKNDQGDFVYAEIDNKDFIIPGLIIAQNPENRTLEELLYLKSLKKNLHFSNAQISVMKAAHQFCNERTKNPGSFPTSGTPKLLVILSNFSNTNSGFSQTQLYQPLTQTNYNGTGCIQEYFMEASINQLNIQIQIINWTNLPNTHDYYGPEAKWGEFALAAITAADPLVDYSLYDNDNDGIVEAVSIIHQGAGQESTINTNDIWSHMWTLSEAGYNLAQRTFDNVELDTYITQPEDDGLGNINTIGIMCHEIGHLLGAPDFYDTDYTNPDYRGTGFWDLQADGSWNGIPMGSQPAHPNLLTKIYYYNWLEADELTYPITISMLYTDMEKQAYYYTTTNENEYFLIEYQEKIGFDYAIPGRGLLIYHVDQNYINSHFSSNNINAGPHQGLTIMDAGNNGNIDDSDCPFPGTSLVTNFTDFTYPNSYSWTGTQTNKPITNITVGNNMASFDFMGGSGCFPPPLQCSNLTSSQITDNSINLQWTRGLGENVLVLAKEGSAININPTGGVPYLENINFGMGEGPSSDIYAIFFENGNQCIVNMLNPGTTYHFALYETFNSSLCYKLPGLKGSYTTTGVPISIRNEKNDNFTIFPTFTNNILNISYPEKYNNYIIEIHDIKGHCIKEMPLSKEISISDIPSGVYVLNFKDKALNNKRFKIIKH